MAALTNPYPGVWFDGSFDGLSQVGLDVFEAPFADEGDPAKYLLHRKYMQRQDKYVCPHTGSVGTTVIGGGLKSGHYIFCNDTDEQDIGGGLITFTREFARVPRARSVPEGYVYSVQQIDGSSGTDQIVEIPIKTTSRLFKEYFYAPSAERFYAIGVIPAVRLVQAGNVIYAIGGTWPVTPLASGEIVAETSQIHSWKGAIVERVTRYVPNDVLTPV